MQRTYDRRVVLILQSTFSFLTSSREIFLSNLNYGKWSSRSINDYKREVITYELWKMNRNTTNNTKINEMVKIHDFKFYWNINFHLFCKKTFFDFLQPLTFHARIDCVSCWYVEVHFDCKNVIRQKYLFPKLI